MTPLRADSCGSANTLALPFCCSKFSLADRPMLIAPSTLSEVGMVTLPPPLPPASVTGRPSPPAGMLIWYGPSSPRRIGPHTAPSAAPPLAAHFKPISRSSLLGNSTTFTSIMTIFSQPTALVKLTICG